LKIIQNNELLILLSLISIMQSQTIFLADQLPAILFNVIDTNGSSGISISVRSVIDRAATKFWKKLSLIRNL
jgi:hypothetical protein